MSTEPNHIKLSRQGALATITLNREKVHNAMHIDMIREITRGMQNLSDDPNIRAVLIEAAGKNFSAGADLNWMKAGMSQSRDQLRSESRELAELFQTIYSSSLVTVAAVQGKVIGGANGIIAACDMVFGGASSSYQFSEVKLGLIPATIAPYVVSRTGEIKAKQWMISGLPVSAEEAHKNGLIDRIAPEQEISREATLWVEKVLLNGPEAVKGVKALFRDTLGHRDPDAYLEETAELIAKFRTSPEGQEGISAFFDKREPSWRDENEKA